MTTYLTTHLIADIERTAIDNNGWAPSVAIAIFVLFFVALAIVGSWWKARRTARIAARSQHLTSREEGERTFGRLDGWPGPGREDI